MPETVPEDGARQKGMVLTESMVVTEDGARTSMTIWFEHLHNESVQSLEKGRNRYQEQLRSPFRAPFSGTRIGHRVGSRLGHRVAARCSALQLRAAAC